MRSGRIWALAVILCIALFLTGCEITPLSEYIDNGESSGISDLQDGTYEGSDYTVDGTQYLKLCRFLRENFKMAMGISVLVGLLVYRVFRFDRRIQQFALYVLIGGGMFVVPLVTYLVCGFYYFLY